MPFPSIFTQGYKDGLECSCGKPWSQDVVQGRLMKLCFDCQLTLLPWSMCEPSPPPNPVVPSRK